MPNIHATAIVEAGARLADTVTVGPYCIIGPDVELGPDVVLQSHVVIAGHTSIGEGTRIFPFASIGLAPQDLKYKGEPSTLVIGRHNLIREYVTMHPGTVGGGMVTRVGDHCLFMASAHVAHDCTVGNRVILANNVPIAGHVTVEDHVIISGNCAVQQFVRIGEGAYVGGMSGVERDLIPFGMAWGDRARLEGLNIIGMQRRGFSRDDIQILRSAYDMIFDSDRGTLADRVAEVAEHYPDAPAVQNRGANTARGLVQPKARNGG
jgi:UDP-N-acetylglucosamine acyltransferase